MLRTVGKRSNLASSACRDASNSDDDVRAFGRRADVDHFAAVLENPSPAQMEVAAEVQAGRDRLVCLEKTSLAAVAAGGVMSARPIGQP